AMTAMLVLHGDHQGTPVPGPLARQDVAAHILLVQPWHDDDERRLRGGVLPRIREYLPPSQSFLSSRLALRRLWIVRIVHDQIVSPDPKQRTANRCSKP